MLKTCKILIILILITVLIAPNVFASDISSILKAGQDFLRVGEDEKDTIKIENLSKVNSNIFNIFFAAAIIIAVVIGIVLGIQFMTSSVEGQAKVKEAVVPYLIGCVIVFAAFPIWEIVVGVGESTEKQTFSKETAEKMAENFLQQQAENNGTVGDVLQEYIDNCGGLSFKQYYVKYLHSFLTTECLDGNEEKDKAYKDILRKSVQENVILNQHYENNKYGFSSEQFAYFEERCKQKVSKYLE